jgi:hypothetical protein
MGESPAVEVEVKHYAGILRHAIRAAGFSVSEVERRLGAGPKSLRRVLGGQVDLKFKHVVAVLRIIGMSQEQFFAIAARRRRQRSLGGDLLAGFEHGDRGDRLQHGNHGDEAELLAAAAKSPGDAGSEDEFDRLVEEAVDRVLARRAHEAKPLSPPPPAPPPPPPPPETAASAGAGGREAGDAARTGGEPG